MGLAFSTTPVFSLCFLLSNISKTDAKSRGFRKKNTNKVVFAIFNGNLSLKKFRADILPVQKGTDFETVLSRKSARDFYNVAENIIYYGMFQELSTLSKNFTPIPGDLETDDDKGEFRQLEV